MRPNFTRLLHPASVLFLLASQLLIAQTNRSYDGWLNHPDQFWGATFTQVVYQSPTDYGDGFSTPSGADRPNPRYISNQIFAQNGIVGDPQGRSAFVWGWGQFIDHDITLSPDHETEAFVVTIPTGDPYFDPLGTGTATIPMLRSQYDHNTGTNPTNPRRHINATTAFIDGSGVYGPDETRAKWLRTGSSGKLKMSSGGMLPYNTVDGEKDSPIDPLAPMMAMPFSYVKKYYVAGDVRANENPFLTSIHTLFVREHNRLCDKLAKDHPDWNDEKIYQKARKLVGGMIEAIVYEEWLPSMGISYPAYPGYQSSVNPGMMNEFVTAAFRYGHTTINGVLNRLDDFGHAIPDGPIALRNAFFNPDAIAAAMGIEPYLEGGVSVAQQHMDCKVIDDLRNFLFGPPGAGGMDLASLNINRGRDRGLLPYNRMRTYFGLPELTSFAQITSNSLVQAALAETYDNDINLIDPWVGMLAEDHMPGAMFGPTAMAIVQEQFLNLQVGDRFYYENDSNLTADEKAEIKGTRLADVIRRNTTLGFFPDEAFKTHIFEESLIRTIDGTQNNPYNPSWGATNTEVSVASGLHFTDGIQLPSGEDRPNPRLISNEIFAQEGHINDKLELSAYAWGFGQFIDHDITLSPDQEAERMDIAIPAYDAYFDPQGTGTQTMPMLRSAFMAGTGTSKANPRMYFNGITAFIDGSAVYGSDAKRAAWLRTFSEGKLKMSAGEMLPYNTITGEAGDAIDPEAPAMAMPFPNVDHYYIAGDVRANENGFLTSIHTLFVREHNRQCDQLKIQHPDWTDEQLYQHARKIVGGLIESIVYEEWLPTLGIDLPAYQGFQADVNPAIMNVFSTAAYRYGHSTIGPEFVMMDNSGNYMEPSGLQLRSMFFNPGIMGDMGDVAPLLAGMTTVHAQDFDCHVIDDLRNFLFGPPGAGGLDLVSLNLNRGRDRGLADFNTIRQEFGLSKLSSFSQLSSDPVLNQHFAFVYQDINKIDPWAGMLAEDHMPGALFGPTAMNIIKRQFTDIRDGDRFYFEVDPVLSAREKADIKATRMADIIRRNTGITFISDHVFKVEEASTSVATTRTSLDVRIYPNPASDELHINLPAETPIHDGAMLQIADQTGIVHALVPVGYHPDGRLQLDISRLPSQRVYVLTLINDQDVGSALFLKQ